MTTTSMDMKSIGSPSLLAVANRLALNGQVTVKYHDDYLWGIAKVREREVHGPRPTSRRRLTYLAFLIGVVVEGTENLSEASRVFNAWKWAIQALEDHGVRPTCRAIKDAKRDVAYLLYEEVVEGARDIDVEAAKWCGDRVSSAVKSWLDSVSTW